LKNQPKSPLTIAIDGPAGSGKSTVARRVAAMLNYLYLDSGAMYRAVALKALQQNISLEDEAAVEALTRKTHIELKAPTPDQATAGLKNRVFLDGREVSHEIRSSEVAQAASRLGTVVFPHAELKIFLEASPSVRAERRWMEHQEKGELLTIEEVLAEVRERDKRDRERKVSPLGRAADAVLVDNTAIDAEETARLIVFLAHQRQK
jgi:CMP/dCMP kinase